MMKYFMFSNVTCTHYIYHFRQQLMQNTHNITLKTEKRNSSRKLGAKYVMFCPLVVDMDRMISGASLAILVAVICVSTRHSDQTESDIPIVKILKKTRSVENLNKQNGTFSCKIEIQC